MSRVIHRMAAGPSSIPHKGKKLLEVLGILDPQRMVEVMATLDEFLGLFGLVRASRLC